MFTTESPHQLSWAWPYVFLVACATLNGLTNEGHRLPQIKCLSPESCLPLRFDVTGAQSDWIITFSLTCLRDRQMCVGFGGGRWLFKVSHYTTLTSHWQKCSFGDIGEDPLDLLVKSHFCFVLICLNVNIYFPYIHIFAHFMCCHNSILLYLINDAVKFPPCISNDSMKSVLMQKQTSCTIQYIF